MTAPPEDGTLFRCECCELRTCRGKNAGGVNICDACFDHYASAGTWTEVPRLQIEAEHERMRAQAARETGAATGPPGGGPCAPTRRVDCELACEIPPGLDLTETDPDRDEGPDVFRCPNECGKVFTVRFCPGLELDRRRESAP